MNRLNVILCIVVSSELDFRFDAELANKICHKCSLVYYDPVIPLISILLQNV